MQRTRLYERWVSWLFWCGAALPTVGCAADDPAGENAGSGGTRATAGTGGSGGAGAPAAGTNSGAGVGGSAGSATNGGAGTGAGGGAGVAAGVGGGGGLGGSAGDGVSGGGTAGMLVAGGASGASGSMANGGAGGSGGSNGGMGGSAAAGMAGANAGGSGGAGSFALTSPSHAEGAEFAAPFTCAEAGFNGSILPELRWTAGPPATMSYAITFIDVTLTNGEPPSDLGYHWVIWNIPASTRTLPEAFKDQNSIGAMENRDFLGPCPNAGGGSANTDTYEFTIYALSEATLSVSGSGTDAVKDAETKLEAMNLAKAKLTGTSNASP